MRLEEAVGHFVKLAGIGGVVAEIGPRHGGGLGGHRSHVPVADRPRGLAEADEMPAYGEGFQRPAEGLGADAVIDDVGAAPAGQVLDGRRRNPPANRRSRSRSPRRAPAGPSPRSTSCRSHGRRGRAPIGKGAAPCRRPQHGPARYRRASPAWTRWIRNSTESPFRNIAAAAGVVDIAGQRHEERTRHGADLGIGADRLAGIDDPLARPGDGRRRGRHR